MIKLRDYLMLVCLNKFFLIGLVAGYVLKAVYGGIMISLFSGLVGGVLLHEVVKLIFWR